MGSVNAAFSVDWIAVFTHYITLNEFAQLRPFYGGNARAMGGSPSVPSVGPVQAT